MTGEFVAFTGPDDRPMYVKRALIAGFRAARETVPGSPRTYLHIVCGEDLVTDLIVNESIDQVKQKLLPD